MTGDVDHQPVLADEVVRLLEPVAGRRYVDATLGLGGHSAMLLERGAHVVALDRDPESIERARARLAGFERDGRLLIRNADYRDLLAVLVEQQTGPIDGLIADLGVSSYHMLSAERGFSIAHDGPLDMRMDRSRGTSAEEVVNCWDEAELVRILFEYGEEREARRIARAILRARAEAPIATTAQLAGVVESAKRRPRPGQRQRLHPATLTFQALRIAVNDELRGIDRFVRDAVTALKRGGRLLVIAFHSLEDRPVKHTLRTLAKGCVCPPALPFCACGLEPQVRLVVRRPIRPSEAECERNPRARSARLRAAEKITDSVAPELETAA